MAVNDPAGDLYTALDTALTTLTGGTNLFKGPPSGPDTPDTGAPIKCVFVWASGGPAALAFVGWASGDTEMRESSVSIRVRSAREDYEGGQTLARSVRDAIHHASISGYIDTFVRESDPWYLSATEWGHEFSLNVTMLHKS